VLTNQQYINQPFICLSLSLKFLSFILVNAFSFFFTTQKTQRCVWMFKCHNNHNDRSKYSAIIVKCFSLIEIILNGTWVYESPFEFKWEILSYYSLISARWMSVWMSPSPQNERESLLIELPTIKLFFNKTLNPTHFVVL